MMSILNKAQSQVTTMSSVMKGFCSVVSLDPPIVKIPDLGMLEGSVTKSAWSGKKIYQFMGVKYGQPPIGSRRFKAPVPVEPWEGIKMAKRFGQFSPVYRMIKKFPKEQLNENIEDCLDLCVYSKNLEEKKPVMVYIHGGKLYDGGAFQHPPQFLLEKDIVLVVPQYRLGPLGFLSTQTDEIPGNAGALDVILALEWVKKNIANFGGDPENITLAGQSAGADIVSAMTFSPLVPDNLFHKVILQSASVFGHWMFDDNFEPKMRDIAARCGMDPLLSIEELNKKFMTIDTLTLLRAFTQHIALGTGNGANTICGHRLTIGGPSNFLPKHPIELYRKGDGMKNLPMLTGCTTNDGTYAIAEIYDAVERLGFNKKDSSLVEIVEESLKVCGGWDISGTLGYLAIHNFFSKKDLEATNIKDVLDGLIDLTGVITFKSPVLRQAQVNTIHNKGRTYLYTFDYKGEHSAFQLLGDTTRFPFEAGVTHGDDNIYLFPFPKTVAVMNDADKEMSKRMVDLWTSFATTGVPSADGVPEWPHFNNAFGPYMHINDSCEIGINFLEEFHRSKKDTLADSTVDSLFGKIINSNA